MATLKNGVRMDARTNPNDKVFDIVDGPSLDRVMDAFKYCYPKRKENISYVELFFLAKNGYRTAGPIESSMAITEQFVLPFIDQISHEDGSGTKLLIRGSFQPKRKDLGAFVAFAGKPCQIYYNAKTRKGWVKIAD